MSPGIRYEARLFLMSVGTGAGLMMVYDCVRIFRIFCPHRNWAVGLEDLLCGIYCAVMTFSLLYEQNDGNLRGFCIFGVILGMTMYQRLVSRRVIRQVKRAVTWLGSRRKRRKTNGLRENR